MTVEMDERMSATVGVLRRQAQTHDLNLRDYLELLADAAVTTTFSPLTDDEFDRAIDELSAGATLSVLPADFSRFDVYREHD